MTLEDFFRKHDFSADVDADALLAEFDRQMDEGLAAGAQARDEVPERAPPGLADDVADAEDSHTGGFYPNAPAAATGPETKAGRESCRIK